jgi:NADPH:quinone reductase
MRAIVLQKFGGLDSLVYTDIPKPLPKDGAVVIKVRRRSRRQTGGRCPVSG